MNKLLIVLISFLLIYGCTTSSDDNGNSTTTVVPVPPTNLTGTVASPTQINLSWTDNSTNEMGFKIERRTGSENYAIVGNANADILIFSDTGLLPNTSYIYRVYSYNSAGKSPTYSNEISIKTTAVIATISTAAVSSITQTTAISGGTITNDGGATITARGVCWSTSANPTITLSTKTIDGSGAGAFTSAITVLTANTTYYVRAYATNSVGTAYGNEVIFTSLQSIINILGPNVTDIDGNVYASVTNCGLTFTKTNLNVSKYSDGTPIPQVTDPTAWVNLTTGAWCYYENNTANGTVYGKLYNWYAVAGIYDAASLANPALRKKLAPTGWHVPTDVEWTKLTDCLGGGEVAGGKMKSTGTKLWKSPNTAATNESGFTGLPASGRDDDSGTFFAIGNEGFWWSSTQNGTATASFCQLIYFNGGAYRVNANKKNGFSVRCLRD